MNSLFIFLIFVYLIVISLALYIPFSRKKKIKEKIDELANNTSEVTPEEFFNIRNARIGKKHISSNMGFSGVYILYNCTKNMYYVGQGKNVLNRVNSHFTGHGNGDVYADYKYGDKFKIKMIKLDGSGFSTLNELERCTIMTYDAYSKGYNRTRGNRK